VGDDAAGNPNLDWVRLLREREQRPLVVSSSERPEHILGALDAGAQGYLAKSVDAAQLMAAIRDIAAGRIFLTPGLAVSLIMDRQQLAPRPIGGELTDRERDVLVSVAAGLTDQEVARDLRIRVSTVRSHLDHIREKTGYRRRAELALHAVNEGLYDPRELSRTSRSA
jgi:DNA-binding NarL/FixJ family response regulator